MAVMITAFDIYAMTQESQTACHLLPKLCALAGVAIDDVKAPPARADRHDIQDPFESIPKGKPAPVTLALK